MSKKNSGDTIGNRTSELLACSAVPQPTAPPRAPTYNRVLNCIKCIVINRRFGCYKRIYRVSIMSFPDYSHLLQDNCVKYNRSSCCSVLMCCKKILELSYTLKKNACVPRSFLVINIFNQGKTLCSPCTNQTLVKLDVNR
jgi:hypothetical protein